MKLVLRYSRNIRNAGCCTGSIAVLDAADNAVGTDLVVFTDIEFAAMLHLYATWVKQFPDHRCMFQRTDKAGFPLTDWAPTDAELLRSNTDKIVADLSQIRNVTYDMRPNKEEKK